MRVSIKFDSMGRISHRVSISIGYRRVIFRRQKSYCSSNNGVGAVDSRGVERSILRSRYVVNDVATFCLYLFLSFIPSNIHHPPLDSLLAFPLDTSLDSLLDSLYIHSPLIATQIKKQTQVWRPVPPGNWCYGLGRINPTLR